MALYEILEDGTPKKVAGNGAMGISETRLYNGSSVSNAGTTITLNDSISNYKELIFIQNYDSYFTTDNIPVDFFKLMTGNNSFLVYVYGDTGVTRCVAYQYVDDTHINLFILQGAKFFTVYGVK